MIVLTYNIVPQSKFAPIKMNLAHNDASLQQSLVTPFATLPLSIAVCVSCDNNELRDNVVYLPLTKLMLQHVKRVLNDIHDVSKYVHCLVNKKDELELLSSFNTLGYIEFDILCNLNCLKEKLKFDSRLLSFHYCSLHIGKYDNKGEYLVHKVYICSNLKTPFGLQQHDQIMDYTNASGVLHSSSTFVLMQYVQP
jgi:hypothetical protein